ALDALVAQEPAEGLGLGFAGHGGEANVHERERTGFAGSLPPPRPFAHGQVDPRVVREAPPRPRALSEDPALLARRRGPSRDLPEPAVGPDDPRSRPDQPLADDPRHHTGGRRERRWRRWRRWRRRWWWCWRG